MTTIITSIIAILGPIITAYFTMKKRDEYRLEKLTKLSQVIQEDKSTKLEVSELFRMATGLRMNYLDIIKIINDDDAIWLVYILEKTSGLVEYYDGKLHYKQVNKNLLFRKVSDIMEKIQIYTLVIVYIGFSILLIFASSIEIQLVLFVMLAIVAISIVYLKRSLYYSAQVKKLVERTSCDQ